MNKDNLDELTKKQDDLYKKHFEDAIPDDIDLQKGEMYLSNKRLPKADIEIEWTEDKVKELCKTQQDILHFAENYFHIVTLDDGKIKIKFYDAQKRVLQTLQDNRFVITLASRQVGKCVHGGTNITIRNKTTGKIEKIAIKDFYNRLESNS